MPQFLQKLNFSLLHNALHIKIADQPLQQYLEKSRTFLIVSNKFSNTHQVFSCTCALSYTRIWRDTIHIQVCHNNRKS